MSARGAPTQLEVSSGGVRLFAERWGHADSVVVLSHGFGGSARNFRPQARRFAERHSVVLFDARGHARSEAPAEPEAYVPERFVADLGAVLDQAGVRRAVVGGLSMGAGISLRFALSHPERVRGLVLAAFPRARDAPGHVDWARGFARSIREDGLDAAGREYAWGAVSRFDPKGADLIRRGFAEHRPLALAHVLEQLIVLQPSPTELARELAALGLPTLVVVGTADAGSLGPCRDLGRLIPRARLMEIEDGGHVVNLTNPVEFDHALGSFLAELA